MIIWHSSKLSIGVNHKRLRIYRTISPGNLTVKDYFWNPLRNYRNKIERELAEKYVKILESKK